jgi:hypothetical protein
MRTAAQIQEKIDHLVALKEELKVHFRVIDMAKQRHAVMAAYYRTLDNETAMLRWALGQVEETWSDDLSQCIDMTDHFDSLPPTEFVHLPYGKNMGFAQAPGEPGPELHVVQAV